MHLYELNKYTDMKPTWLLCFYAFITQKSFTTTNFSQKHLILCTLLKDGLYFLLLDASTAFSFFNGMGGVHMSEMFFFFIFLQLYFFNCLQSKVIKCLLNFYYWTPQLPVGGGGAIIK